MAQQKAINGFSKLTSAEKISWLKEEFELPDKYARTLNSHLHSDKDLQALYAEFSENTVSNFFIPFGLAPNFLINGKWYVLPMAIEESSVVAAAAHAAKFWSAHGGFHAEVPDTRKIGQVHFFWTGNAEYLQDLLKRKKNSILADLEPLTASMEKRGGGILDIRITDQSAELADYYRLHVEFRTADAMGANFINSVLEALAKKWNELLNVEISSGKISGHLEINMSILSNYTPESLVRAWVECPPDALGIFDTTMSGRDFAEKFVRATEIARVDTFRAVTHNKGIFNGVDALVIATGNDFRAVEACGHAYAARDGRYRGLSRAGIKDNIFHFELELPMSVGTVGGLTSGHPMAQSSLKILGDPDANELMMIIATAGLANNFSAVRSLITKGIQQGHMKMHLTNILHQLGATKEQKQAAIDYFSDKTVSYAAVKEYIADKKT